MKKLNESFQPVPNKKRTSFHLTRKIWHFLLTVTALCFVAQSIFAQAPGQQNQSGSAPARTSVVQPRTTVGPIYSKVPELTPEQLKAQERELNEVNRLPLLPGEPINAAPVTPPTEVNTQKASPPQSGPNVLPQAPNDFTYKRIHDLTPTEASSSRSVIDEPSVANVGSTLFYTGNWFAARSSDGGQSFTYVNPYNTFPSINNGFCCDQVANYAPSQDMVIWALQYVKDSSSNTLRLARAIGETAVANNTWTYYDFNPQSFGFPTNNWLDFPNVTVSDNFIYLTSNVFTTGTDTYTGCVIWRISRSELAAGGFINFNYFTRTDVNTLRCTEGAHTTMYWGALLSTTQVRIHRWDDGSGTIFWDNVNVSSFIYLNRDGVATTSDGTNWAARADSRILGSWVAGGVIGLMWGAKQGGSFPYPYTTVARFNQSDRTLINQTQIWNSQYAWLYPTASVNSAGNLAGLLTAGGGTLYPLTNIFISDDVQNGFSPLAVYFAASSNTGPTSNAWGDYQTVRPHKLSPNTWVASTHSLSSTSNVVPRYLWFGRERDLPTPVILNSAVSRKMHGSAGTFDINLPVTGGPRGVECRSGGAGGNYRLVFTFANPLTSVASASVTSGVGSVPGNHGTIGANTHQYIVNLTGVANAQYLTVKLTEVRDNATHVGDVFQQLGFLLGDTSSNGAVNSSDISQTKGESGAAVTGSNFRTEVSVNGAINSSDISIIKSKSGTALPSPP